jgi:hypothetical protein
VAVFSELNGSKKDARDPVRVFIGADERQPVALSVLQDSINWRSSRPVSLQLLKLDTLPIKRRGLTTFTFSRFLVPWLCDFRGSAIFMDADILVTGDIADLAACADLDYDVQVMQGQPKFEWASLMLFNCARCRPLTPEFIEDTANNLFDFKWAKSVGTLPKHWNRCVGYTAGDEPAALYHYTQGLPVWEETRGNFPEDALWLKQFKHANSTVPWKELMGNSVHAPHTIQRMKARA